MPAEFSHGEERTARKDYRCASCSGPIPKGTRHTVHTGRDDMLGGLFRYRRHLSGECRSTSAAADKDSTTMLRVKDPAALAAAVKAGPGSYRKAAEVAEMSHSFIAHLCQGRRDTIALPMALRLAAAVGQPSADLFVLDDAPLLAHEGLV